MKQNYDEALRRVLASEGGYTNDLRDPGGATNYGITIADYRMYVKPDADAADVRAMSLESAKAIYRSKYWNAVRGDELPSGVDYTVFDFGVNSGVRRAIKYLQRALGVGMDGELGPATMAAIEKADPAKLIVSVNDTRLAFLQSLGTWSAFGKGWGSRVASVKAASLAMARAPIPPPDIPAPEPKPAQPASGGFLFAFIKFALSIFKGKN